MSAIEPTDEQLAALATLPADDPVVMINLLRFKQPGGAESYGVYAEKVQPHVDRAGARLLFWGSGRQMVIGPDANPWWDAILVVEYPSVRAFLEMVSDPEYQAVHVHRAEGLERAELIATAPGAPAQDS
jgi:uncharacterized protein (DUF1330 family)